MAKNENMLYKETFNDFVLEVNCALQQFYIWMYANNEFVKHQKEWNKESFSRDNGCKYKNFWHVVIPTLQKAWMLRVIRLLEAPYFGEDKTKPNISLFYVLELLEDNELKESMKKEIDRHQNFIDSIRKQRPNLAHNTTRLSDKIIKAGIEDLFKSMGNIIIKIKDKNLDLRDCNDIDEEDIKQLSKRGIDEIFEALSK